MVNHHILDGDQDQENHHADDVIAAHHEIAEGFDHLARRARAGIALNQDQARGRDVQRQAEQGQQQQRGGKNIEFDRLGDVQGDHQNHDRQREIGADQHVQQKRRQRHDHGQHDAQHRQRNAQFGELADARRQRLRRAVRGLMLDAAGARWIPRHQGTAAGSRKGSNLGRSRHVGEDECISAARRPAR